MGAAGLLAARSATQITGKPESGQGMKLERLLTSGIAGPVSEATAMFYQVRALLGGLLSGVWLDELDSTVLCCTQRSASS